MNVMNRFSIKDIENLTGIKAHTLRIWEQRHGIIIPKRTETNIRYYDGDDLKQALRVALLNKHGYKISRIQKMSADEITDILSDTSDTDFQFEHLITKLLEATVDMDTDKFEYLLDKYINKYGIEAAVEQLIFNFMQKLGLLWMTSRIFPAQEHLVSNIIHRKILLAIEHLPMQPSYKKKYLLFLPEGELHEIGLMYLQYLLLKNGNRVIYLGANTPIDQVELVYQALKPDHLYTHLTSVSKDFDIYKYISKISEIQDKGILYVSGVMQQRNTMYDIPENVVLINSLEAAKAVATKY